MCTGFQPDGGARESVPWWGEPLWPFSERRSLDSPAGSRVTGTRTDRRPTPAAWRTLGCRPRGAVTPTDSGQDGPWWHHRRHRAASCRLTFPRTTSLLFPCLVSSSRQQTSSFCCSGKLSPSEAPPAPLCDAIRSPYTSDRTRATCGRLTREPAWRGWEEEGTSAERTEEGRETSCKRLAATLTAGFHLRPGRALPLVALHHLHRSPGGRKTTGEHTEQFRREVEGNKKGTIQAYLTQV